MSYVTDKWDAGEVHVADNVVGWFFPETNEHRPFNDKQMIELIDHGVVGQAEVVATAKAYEAHMTTAIANYIKHQEEFWTDPKHEDARNEQLFEMRAAFGPDVEVTNIFTGRKHTT